ncbi:phosphoacetylglucosamine mutase [Desarmillaria tabescens]|uniref:phosphoacetylglucosamine mutase n=1 Tax=Armillaria tabescens TaxID=1929756 RepID=A0AA39MJI6_ARMTA|nr:phosphoacetylglucosamine mutase [Desarmillaria tabescens]KAK0436652.1 phosphoacetylglucosamine mutase [Desarmillaria tabescens]
MASLPRSEIQSLSDLHPKPENVTYQYGTAGFRTLASVLDPVLFRVGIIAALRSKKFDGRTVGVMITASHNPEDDNGVKIVDPRGEMLEASWEGHATVLSNATDFVEALEAFVQTAKIDLAKPSRVVYARDTRPSGPALVAALEDGFKSIGADARNAGVTTTPILHYLVRAINTKGTEDSYGVDSEEGYFKKLSGAFKKLIAGRPTPPPLLIDCANGVGAIAAEQLSQYLGDTLPFSLANTATTALGVLNKNCGADFVKTTQKLPPSLADKLQPGERACSLDGDADRLIQIAALVAAFIVDLVKLAGLENEIKVGIVQTAYANGASTKYLLERLPVKCVPTANGHGTVLFSSTTLATLKSHQPLSPAQSGALEHLISLTELINQTVGDALSDMLLVEVVLAHKSYTGVEWDSLYAICLTGLSKWLLVIGMRSARKMLRGGLLVLRGFSRRLRSWLICIRVVVLLSALAARRTVVRVYAEAAIRAQADELAFRVAGLVYDEAGGDAAQRPKEFL